MIQLSLLDCLMKNPPLGEDQASNAAYRESRDAFERQMRAAVRTYGATVRRDLEWLLNTRRIVSSNASGGHAARRSELAKSLYFYGLPSFSYVSLSPDAQIADVNR